MKKTTKNININYNFATGEWTARDNGEIIAKGEGIDSAAQCEKALKAEGRKPVKFNWKW